MTFEDRLAAVLYLLMRDELPTGVVTKIINDCSNLRDFTEYSNSQLIDYSRELVSRLK